MTDSSKMYVAIDLGGTNLRVGLVDEKLGIVQAIREKTVHKDKDSLYEQIKRMLSVILSMYKGQEPLKYIGISAAGFCENGILKFSPNLAIRDFDLPGQLNKDFPNMKAIMANDANCSALIEALAGAAKGYADSFFFTVSTGIGAGLIYNGKLVDLPFEVGHNYIGYQNRFYEIENLCSGTGIVTLAKLNGLELESPSELFALVMQQDKLGTQVYNDWLRLFGSVVANAQITYNPEVIVLSGGVMKSKAVFWEDLKKVAQAFAAPFPVRKIRLVCGKFDQDTGLMGGAAVAIEAASGQII